MVKAKVKQRIAIQQIGGEGGTLWAYLILSLDRLDDLPKPNSVPLPPHPPLSLNEVLLIILDILQTAVFDNHDGLLASPLDLTINTNTFSPA